MQFLTERHSGKTKQITNWSVSSSKVKLKFFRFKIVKYETRAFKRKIETKPIRNLFILLNISCLPRTITSDIVVRFSRRILCTIQTIGSCFYLCTIELWSTWGVWRALKKLELPSAIASGNSYSSFVRALQTFTRAP